MAVTIITITRIDADMTERGGVQALLRLMAWLSPAFPVGSFAYSGGLESAVHDRLVTDRESLQGWMAILMRHGAAWNDTVLFAEAHRLWQRPEALGDAAALAEALAGSRERHQETMLLGEAFLAAASVWPEPLPVGLPAKSAYPIAVGAIAGAHGVGLAEAVAAYLHAFVSQGVAAAIRLGVIGQNEGVSLLAALEPSIEEIAARAAVSSLDDLGSATFQAEIAALRHETMRVRLFRS